MIVRIVLEGDTLAGNWLITIEHTWNKLTSPEGEATFIGLGEGSYRVVARRGSRTVELPRLEVPSHPPAELVHGVEIPETD